MAIVKVIQYNGSPDVFAWKYPSQELSTGTQLIVNESQEAVLVKGGQVCDVFQAGRHTLTTNNIPILSKLVNIPFGRRSPFAAEVWYINKVFSLNGKWGTSTPVQLQDPKYKVFVPLRAFGQFGLRIEESKKFLIKLVGTMPIIDKAAISDFFRGVYLTKIKDAISSYLVRKNIGILEMNAYLEEISVFLQERLSPVFAEYGIKLVSFFVNDINVPEGDEGVIRLKKALAKKAEMDIVGYSYQQERSFDTLEGVANNSGSMSGGLMGAGIGLGVGVGMGGTVAEQFGSISKTLNANDTKECPDCKGRIGANEQFCRFCGCDTSVFARGKAAKSDIKCSNCGTIVAGSVKFCPECGRSIIKKCSNCGREMESSTKFCPECGTPAN